MKTVLTTSHKKQDWRYIDHSKEENLEDIGNLFNQEICGVVKRHLHRLEDIREATALYDNRMYASFLGTQLGDMGFRGYEYFDDFSIDTKLHINLIQSNVDTLVAKISKFGILPRIVSSGAQWHVRENAKVANRWVRGMFKKLEVSRHASKALLHACLYGSGFLKVCADESGIDLISVAPDEVFVDYTDSHYGEPTTIWHVGVTTKATLKAEYPDMAQEIEDTALSIYDADAGGYINNARQGDESLLLSECWTLPDPQGNPGKHIIAAGTLVLVCEDWDRDYFPIIKMDYTPPVYGFYSRGLASILKSIQYEYDDTINRMREAQHMISHPKILISGDSEIQPEHISNEITVFRTTGDVNNELRVLTPVSIAGDTFNYAATVKNSSYEVSGVSQLSAMGKLPTGIERASGKALREFHDIETERFSSLGRSYERLHARLGEILIRELKYCDADLITDHLSANSPIREISFKDLFIDIDKFIVDIFAVSDMPSHPTSRQALGEELAQSGYLDAEEASALIGMPDVDATIELKRAPRKAVEKILDRTLNDKNYDPTEHINEYIDLEYLREQALLQYNQAFVNGDEDDEDTEILLGKFKSIFVTVNSLLNEASAATNAQQQAPVGVQPPQPQGNPLQGGQVMGEEPTGIPPELLQQMGM